MRLYREYVPLVLDVLKKEQRPMKPIEIHRALGEKIRFSDLKKTLHYMRINDMVKTIPKSSDRRLYYHPDFKFEENNNKVRKCTKCGAHLGRWPYSFCRECMPVVEKEIPAYSPPPVVDGTGSIRVDVGIDYCNRTWNPIKGCLHWKTGECEVGNDCWAKRFAETRLKGRYGYENGFAPMLLDHRLIEPYSWKKPSIICTAFMSDMFGVWVPSKWIDQVLEVEKDNSHHIFLHLTKNPGRYHRFNMPRNAWCGTSIGVSEKIWRGYKLTGLKNRKWLSVEPLMESIGSGLNSLLEEVEIDWVVVGAKSGRNASQPKKEWVEEIIRVCEHHGVPVFVKRNVKVLRDEIRRYQQFPVHDSQFSKILSGGGG